MLGMYPASGRTYTRTSAFASFKVHGVTDEGTEAILRFNMRALQGRPGAVMVVVRHYFSE
jgi:hypothetical protein